MTLLTVLSSGGALPLPPVPSRTPSPQHPTKDHLSSPVKPVAQHFAEHKRDEVQAFGYDKELHQLEVWGEQDFLTFLGVDEAFINVEPPSAKVTGKQPSGKQPEFSRRRKKASGRKASGKKANGKGSGNGSAEGDAEASGERIADASEFSLTNFVQAANTLAKSMKEKRECFLSL